MDLFQHILGLFFSPKRAVVKYILAVRLLALQAPILHIPPDLLSLNALLFIIISKKPYAMRFYRQYMCCLLA